MLSISAGEELLNTIVITATLTQHHVTRSFCKQCGSPLFLRTTNPFCKGLVGVTAGTIDFDSKLPPQENIALAWKPDGEAFVQYRLLCLSEITGASQVATGEK